MNTSTLAPVAPPVSALPAALPPPAPAPSPGGTVPVAAESDATAAAPVGTDLNLIQRAVARISGIPTESTLAHQVLSLTRDRDELREQIAERIMERDEARAALAESCAALAAHEADLSALRAALDTPVTAASMQTPAGQAAAAVVTQQVSAHLRALSHPAANLPLNPAADGDAAAATNRPDNLREAFKAETDPVKKAALFRQIKNADESSKARAN